MRKSWIVGILLAAAVAGAAESPRAWAPKEHDGYTVKENRIYYRRGQAGLILEAPDAHGIATYYSERGSGVGNPFTRLGPEIGEGTIFLLTLINRTNGSLTFTPNYVALRIKTEATFPMDFTTFLGLLDQVNSKVRVLLNKSIFHSPETVPAGRIVSKFILFPSIPRKAQELRLDFDSLYFEDKDARASFYFIRKL